MSKEILIAIFTGLIAVISATIALWGQFRVSHLNREFEKLKLKAETEKAMARYREPLVRAAADLQSRLYNILALNFVDVFLINGTEREREYATQNTVFLFAQFFAWTEAVRLEIQFISLDEDMKTRELSSIQSRIYSLIQTDSYKSVFRVFAGEQRAIGERMLTATSTGSKCLGYGEFLAKDGLREDKLISALYKDVENLKIKQSDATNRLLALQHALIDLMDFLDPNHLRFPIRERTKYQLPTD